MAAEAKKVPASFYRNAGGSEPVREWLLSMARAERKAIGEDIATVEYGWPVGMPTCSPMGAGLFEVRTELDDNRSARVFFCFHEGFMVLLHGIIKKTRKTPKGDLAIARARQKEVQK